MSLADFFTPINKTDFSLNGGFIKGQFGFEVLAYEHDFPELTTEEKPQIALIGVAEERGGLDNKGTAKAADAVRKHFYSLYQADYKVRVADLGNILAGQSIQDTYFAVQKVVAELVRLEIIPIIIGGSHDLTYAQYAGYEELEQKVELAVIDNKFDLDVEPTEDLVLTAQNFLNHIILKEPSYLFNLNVIAYQTYFVNRTALNMFDKLYFNATRVGMISGRITQAEPVIRAADMVSFDISAIRASEAPGNAYATPNGLYGDEACQLCRYAGMSDKCTSIGFYEFNPAYDPMQQTGMLLAQMVWCFIDGYYNRKQDTPLLPKSSYIIYRTTLENEEHELVFVKSKKSDRWWMQVPYFGSRSVNERYYLVPCRYDDYQTAVSGEMPDLWWKTHQKLQ
ncbi:formimidoylglutamase [Sphingobacteriaceae bacterium WQ 2009]|uniref:Formimidoylglutamase n=1 Tax=Rhinopithecimicrobium faecis TaxID=2820698 RepID=A0A8T4HDJ2_9SPHI|nr:formimidoylglutamase [Sphingobacteriaceae bacterium WQ 2009]